MKGGDVLKKSTYKLIDMLIFSGIACVLEAVNVYALKIFTTELFTLSVILPITLIVTMRWKGWAIIPAILGGITYCIVCGANASQYLIYGAGNAFAVLNLFWFKLKSPKAIKSSLVFCMLFVLSGYIFINLGRTLMSMFFEQQFLQTLLSFLAIDLLNVFIAFLVIAIARKQNGLFENQDEYLLRISQEKKEEIYG